MNSLPSETRTDHRDDAPKTSEAKHVLDDPLLGEAIRIVLESKQVSVIQLQRRLAIGYSRAARLAGFITERPNDET